MAEGWDPGGSFVVSWIGEAEGARRKEPACRFRKEPRRSVSVEQIGWQGRNMKGGEGKKSLAGVGGCLDLSERRWSAMAVFRGILRARQSFLIFSELLS
ncbi:hypothetical protein [Gluconacetobacter sacchari]|uniref:Uncharacterized protein n=1 Tax=Gluconacetobacter sacchari TaxID=92759 RepID=A0A7W4IFW3_9PROT|nr:hypothetical protein [Gluconacetobacter sacchari]MBB2161987.1 hypothetical protein [Gluconacetobacter sacchari]